MFSRVVFFPPLLYFQQSIAARIPAHVGVDRPSSRVQETHSVRLESALMTNAAPVMHSSNFLFMFGVPIRIVIRSTIPHIFKSTAALLRRVLQATRFSLTMLPRSNAPTKFVRPLSVFRVVLPIEIQKLELSP